MGHNSHKLVVWWDVPTQYITIARSQVSFFERDRKTTDYVSFPEPCDVWSPLLSACRLERMYVGPMGPTTLPYLFSFYSTLSHFLANISSLLSPLFMCLKYFNIHKIMTCVANL
jgi:hypothetical protein